METKKCSVCGIEKNIDEFFKKHAGHDNKCKDCRLAYNRDRYERLIAPQRKKYTYEDVEVKVCTRCKNEKSVTEFNLHHAKTSGSSKYRGECKLCQAKSRDREKARARAKIYNDLHVEERKQKKKEYLSNPENREKSRVYAREYAHKRPEMQRRRLLAKYGLDQAGYDALLQKQDNKCAICGKDNNGKHKVFVIDHCHKTDIVRGLLCKQCNAGLGNYKDSPSLLRKAARYLESFINH